MNILTMEKKLETIMMLSFQLSNRTYGADAENGLPTAFTEIMGHTGHIRIMLYENGWTSEAKPTHAYTIYFHDGFGKSESPERLDEIIDEMDRLCEKRYKLTMEVE
jgi:hypothetical protein